LILTLLYNPEKKHYEYCLIMTIVHILKLLCAAA
jgi:hypothetical protein